MATLARKFRFTQRDLDRLPPCPQDAVSKAYEVSDTEVTGLRLSVTKGGRKFWFWRYTFDGRKRAARIGEYPATDLAAARKRAGEMRSMLDMGKDAQEEKDELKAMPSFAEFAEREYMPMAMQTKRSHKDDAHRLKNHLLPRFGHKKLSEISTREIQAFIGEIANSRTPATANRILSLIARMLKLATIWGIIEKNPCYGIAKFREQRARERFLTSDEISRLFQAMEGDSHIYGIAWIKFLLLTGLRRNEALRAKWEQVDLGRGLMHLPQTKSGKSRHIVLSAQARMLLEGLPSHGHSQWIFPGKNLADDRPVYNIDKCLQRLLEKAGIDRMRVHDLRHTYLLAQDAVLDRLIFDNWRKTNCFKTIEDFQNWEAFRAFHMQGRMRRRAGDAGADIASSSARSTTGRKNLMKDGYVGVAKRTFLAAYQKRLWGLEGADMSQRDLAYWLTERGYKTSLSAVKNGTGDQPEEHVVPGALEVMLFLNMLKERFAGLEIERFLIPAS